MAQWHPYRIPQGRYMCADVYMYIYIYVDVDVPIYTNSWIPQTSLCEICSSHTASNASPASSGCGFRGLSEHFYTYTPPP